MEWKQDIEEWFLLNTFTKRKTGPSSIFVTATEFTWICSPFGDNGYRPNRWVTSQYRQARQNLFTWWTHYSIYGIQGFLFLQKDSRREYKWLFGTVQILLSKIMWIWNHVVRMSLGLFLFWMWWRKRKASKNDIHNFNIHSNERYTKESVLLGFRSLVDVESAYWAVVKLFNMQNKLMDVHQSDISKILLFSTSNLVSYMLIKSHHFTWAYQVLLHKTSHTSCVLFFRFLRVGSWESTPCFFEVRLFVALLLQVFSDISSIEYKTVPAIWEEVETVNFNQYQSGWEQKTYQGNKTNPIDCQDKKISHSKCNWAKHIVWDCSSFSSRNDINTVVDSDQVHNSLFNVNSPNRTLINDSNIKMSNLVKETFGRTVWDSACSQTTAEEI